MSSAPGPTDTSPLPAGTTPAPAAKPHEPGTRAADRIIVYRHSNLFYWWPVWLIGFLFALITGLENQHLAVVPADTKAAEAREVEVDGKRETRDILILAKDKKHRTRKTDLGQELVHPQIYVTQHKELGTIYAIVLLMVITITNISLRGLWTVLLLVSIIMLTIILTVGEWWNTIFDRLNQLSIYINLGGYILISTVLFILWIGNFLLFDRQTYMVFTPGQVHVRLEIGGEETVYDTTGMVIQRERGDLFRHWVLGFGSGDLIIKPVGIEHPLLFPNVLRIEKIVHGIEKMMKEKVIVRSPVEKKTS